MKENARVDHDEVLDRNPELDLGSFVVCLGEVALRDDDKDEEEEEEDDRGNMAEVGKGVAATDQADGVVVDGALIAEHGKGVPPTMFPGSGSMVPKAMFTIEPEVVDQGKVVGDGCMSTSNLRLKSLEGA